MLLARQGAGPRRASSPSSAAAAARSTRAPAFSRSRRLRTTMPPPTPAPPTAATAGAAAATSADPSSSSSSAFSDLAAEAVTWASQHGLVVGVALPKQPQTELPHSVETGAALVHAPVSLLPVAFPRRRFLQAAESQRDLNALVAAVAADEAWLEQTLAPAAKHDDFTASLLEVLRATRAERAARLQQAANSGGNGESSTTPRRGEVLLGVHRSDYMLDAPSGGFLQVELNTIASSFACLSALTAAMHARLLDGLGGLRGPAAAGGAGTTTATAAAENEGIDAGGQRSAFAVASTGWRVELPGGLRGELPANAAPERIADAMAAAVGAATGWQGGGGGGAASSSSSSSSSSAPLVVMVVQPGERNSYDQQWLAQALWARHRLRVARLTLADIARRGLVAPAPANAAPAAAADNGNGNTPDSSSLEPGALYLKPTSSSPQSPLQRVGLVYFRAGYGPGDYPSGPQGEEWAARALVERSSAAKCPSVAYQLAGSKKVQQALAQPGVVERFVRAAAERGHSGSNGGDDENAASAAAAVPRIRRLFAGLWSLDSPAAQAADPKLATNPDDAAAAAAAADALLLPERYVLKPQREGGGNNLYGPDLRRRLAEGGEGLAAFVLMQRILPPAQRSVLLRDGLAREDDTLSELGVYGTYVAVLKGAGGGGGEGKAGAATATAPPPDDGSGVRAEVLVNEVAGHLVRTKSSTSDEGGVAAGFAVLDSPLLVEEDDGGGGASADARRVLEAAARLL